MPVRGLVNVNAESLDLATAHPDEAVREERQELADLLTPLTKGWGTDVGVELTSLALQVHGGMGYVEETGVAQHYRDIRIAPIYEGTNGIQAMDLVGRKLGLRGGDAIRDQFGRIEGTVAAATAAGGDLATIGERLAGAAGRRAGDDRVAAGRRTRPADLLAGATPYLRLMGMLTGGWMLTRAALAAHAGLDDGAGFDAEFLGQRLVSARFFATQVLPQVAGLAPAVTAGAGDLFAYQP